MCVRFLPRSCPTGTFTRVGACISHACSLSCLCHAHCHTPTFQASKRLNPSLPHILTTFAAGIKRLDMNPPSEERKQYLSMGITSPDGEVLPFVSPVVTEGRPEEWLNRVEDAMFGTTKKHLYRVLEDSKGEGDYMCACVHL